MLVGEVSEAVCIVHKAVFLVQKVSEDVCSLQKAAIFVEKVSDVIRIVQKAPCSLRSLRGRLYRSKGRHGR